MSTLYIPNSVALRNFDSIFKNNNFDFSDGNIDIRFHDKYIALHPIGLAFYAAIYDIIKKNNYQRNASINREIKSIPYLQRMGLFHIMDFQDPIVTQIHEETGRFIPLTKIRNSMELDTFMKSIDPILHTSRDNSRVIKHIFSEVLRNVLEHSKATYGGNVCATYNRKRKKISIGISDAGIGLKDSLSKFHTVETHKDAIIKALTPGISGVTSRLGGNEQNAGAGLFFTKCIAQSVRNHFLIYSGDTYFKLNLSERGDVFNSNPFNDKCTIKDGLPFFKGTLIGVDIHIDDNEAFNRLIENIGKAYRSSVKKEQKDYYSRIKFK